MLRSILNADVEGKPILVWIVAPTYALTQKVFNPLVKWFIKLAPSQKKGISMRPPQKLKTARGSLVECKSTEEAVQLLGEGVDLMIADEAPLIPDQIYFQNLLPTVLDRQGRMIMIGTPRGKGWFYDRFLDGEKNGYAFKFSTIEGENVTSEELAILEEKYPDHDLFRQEYFADFISDASQVFRNFEDIVVPAENIYSSYRPGHYYIMGADLAQAEDYTVITVIDTNNNQVVYWKRFRGVNYPVQVDHIVTTAQEYGNARIIIDSTGLGKPIYEFLLQRGVFVEDFTFTGKSKEELIGKLRLYISQKWITIPDEPELIKELNHFEYKLRNEKTGEPLQNIKYGASKGSHDDTVCSLALAVFGLTGKANPKSPAKQEIERVAQQQKPKETFI